MRHALPGEQVTVEITEDSGRFLRGDAVHVAVPSPHRVPAPCPLAHPGGCGGCDFQHVELRRAAPAQGERGGRAARRGWPALEREVVVEPVPGDQDGLFWRTRMQYVHLPGGDRGLRKHRSHEVVLVDRCLIAHPDAREPDRSGPVVEQVETLARHARASRSPVTGSGRCTPAPRRSWSRR